MPLDLYPPVQRDPFVNPENSAFDDIERDSQFLAEPTAMNTFPAATSPSLAEAPAPLVQLAGPTTEAANMVPLSEPAPLYGNQAEMVTQPLNTTVPPFLAQEQAAAEAAPQVIQTPTTASAPFTLPPLAFEMPQTVEPTPANTVTKVEAASVNVQAAQAQKLVAERQAEIRAAVFPNRSQISHAPTQYVPIEIQ